MQNLSREYLLLFNTLTDLESSLLEIRDRLLSVQRQGGGVYLLDAENAAPENPAS